MIGLGLIVPRDRGEEVRRDLIASGLLRLDLEIRREGEFLVLPLVGTRSRDRRYVLLDSSYCSD